MSKKPYVYDKAKYHLESTQKAGLPERHASNHTVVFLRWLIEKDLMGTFFVQESGAALEDFRAGKATIHDVYESWDCCLIDDMLSEEGNAFARHYFDLGKGRYLRDYIGALQGKLPTEFHIPYTEENYQEMRRTIDFRYQEWKAPKKRRRWPF
jgi:hypothetical protein